jgi:hypothetical protein
VHDAEGSRWTPRGDLCQDQHREPTALRLHEGSPARRPLNDRKPVALLGEPEMPKHLDRDAPRMEALVPLLMSMKVLT